MKLKALAIAAAAMISFGIAGTASADGAAIFTSKACASCHGADAKTPIMPAYPKLAGQNAAYAAQQIKDIRDGKRANGLSVAMKGIIAGMSDADVDAVAEYLSTLK